MVGRSLRWLDDDQLDRLMKAVTEEARRRGRDMPDGLSRERQREERRGSGKQRGRNRARGDSPPPRRWDRSS